MKMTKKFINNMKSTCFIMMLSFISTSVFASGVSLNTTRIIYPQGEKSVSLSARNSTDINYLSKFSITDINNKNINAPFTISPPLVKVVKGSSQEIRVYAQPSNLPTDRESIYYFHAVMIPSTEGPLTNNALSIAYDNVIKLFYRPKNLSMSPEEARAQLVVKATATGVSVVNQSPYYISLNSLVLNGNKVGLSLSKKNTMISPFSYYDYSVPAQARHGLAQWIAINDLGGEDVFSAQIQ